MISLKEYNACPRKQLPDAEGVCVEANIVHGIYTFQIGVDDEVITIAQGAFEPKIIVGEKRLLRYYAHDRTEKHRHWGLAPN